MISEPKINITEKAANKAIELIQSEKDNTDCWGLRLYVQQGGCAGLSYGLIFDTPEEEDILFEDNELTCIIDESSLRYIHGSKLDYEDGLQGGGFTFDNPNTVSECGCGESFRTN